jgi:hypothetical protein
MKTLILFLTNFFTNFLTNNSQMYRDWVSEKERKTTLTDFEKQLNIFQEKINNIKKLQTEIVGKNEEYDKLLEKLINNLEKLYKIHFSEFRCITRLYKPIEPVKYIDPIDYCQELIDPLKIGEYVKRIREYQEWKLQNPQKTYIQDDFINECYNVKPEDLK